MEPITREEYYLAKIAGTYKGKTPEPVTIDEYYLATMAGDYSGNTPQPVTRLQYYMAKVAGVWGGSIPAPVTRLEYYWAAIANGEGTVFPPVTREEHFLVLVADAYSVVLTVVTGNPALLENSKGNRGLESLTLYGISTQGSTTGANLLPCSEKEVVTTLKEYKFKNPLPAGGYRVSIKSANRVPAGTTFQCAMKYVDGNSVYRNMSHETKSVIMIATNAVVSFTIYSDTAYNESNGKTTIFTGLMINVGDATVPYEPYTGGKPSPSPEYPQEIESVGQGKTIGVEVRGKNLLNPLRFFSGRTHNGITWTVKNNGEIVCEGTALGESFLGNAILYPDVRWLKIPAGRYVLSGSGEHVMVYINIVSLNGDAKGSYYCQYNSSIKCVFTEDVYITLQAMVRSGETVAETVCPQLESGDTATSYEPYHEPQFASIATPNGLPGIPVSSGGNYTDEKGQQWVCDTIEFRNGVGEMVQRIERIDFKAERWQIMNRFDATGGIFFFSKIKKTALYGLTVMGTTSNILRIGNPYSDFGDYVWVLTKNDESECRIGFADSTIDSTEKLTNLLNSLPEAYAMYCLAEPIRTPLPPETIAAYKALRTYSPTTTVINDACAGMSVGYAKMK